MSKARNTERTKAPHKRVIFSLPPDLVSEAKQFAGAFHNGNSSGFVAAAIRAYIDHLRKVRHTARLRESYAAAAKHSRKLSEAWDPLSDEVWAKLDAKRPGQN
ncbi:MAG: hypothetical protein WD847_12930 [Pirellulales bacterium]